MNENDSGQSRVYHRLHGDLQPELRPIVIDYKKKGKKKRSGQDDAGKEKYSTGFKDVQLLEKDALRISQKAAKALSKGLDTYDQERQKSARKKTDGAMDDYLYNSTKAASAFIKETADIPVDLVESVNRLSMGKRLRKRLRRDSRALRMWRI